MGNLLICFVRNYETFLQWCDGKESAFFFGLKHTVRECSIIGKYLRYVVIKKLLKFCFLLEYSFLDLEVIVLLYAPPIMLQ